MKPPRMSPWQNSLFILSSKLIKVGGQIFYNFKGTNNSISTLSRPFLVNIRGWPNFPRQNLITDTNYLVYFVSDAATVQNNSIICVHLSSSDYHEIMKQWIIDISSSNEVGIMSPHLFIFWKIVRMWYRLKSRIISLIFQLFILYGLQ